MKRFLDDLEINRAYNTLSDGIAVLRSFLPELDEREQAVLTHAEMFAGQVNFDVLGRHGFEAPDREIADAPDDFPENWGEIPQALDDASAQIAEALLRRGLRWDR